jgi:hypothetical protein
MSNVLNAALSALWRFLCTLDDFASMPHACVAQPLPYSAVAVSMFLFGCWMLLLGAGIGALSFFSNSALARKVHDLAVDQGFPPELALWARLFGVAIGIFSLFYFAAAAFDLRVFVWMSVFGRMGVFAVVMVLAWQSARPSSYPGIDRPHNLLWFAVPDLASALVTACLVLPHPLAATVFIGGGLLVMLALGFFTFPVWLLRLAGVALKPGSWNVVLGSLLAFFGAYGIAAALSGLVPIMLAALLAHVLMLSALLLGLFLAAPRATFDGAASLWRLRAVVGALLVAAVVVTASGVHERRTRAQAAAVPAVVAGR